MLQHPNVYCFQLINIWCVFRWCLHLKAFHRSIARPRCTVHFRLSKSISRLFRFLVFGEFTRGRPRHRFTCLASMLLLMKTNNCSSTHVCYISVVRSLWILPTMPFQPFSGILFLVDAQENSFNYFNMYTTFKQINMCTCN